MTNKKVTIKDVAKQSGVSIATVSQILNNNQEKFSPKTVEKVIQAKELLGYEPDYFARRMIMKKSKTIGVLLPDITNSFFSLLLSGIENVLYREKFITMLCNADLDATREAEYLEELSRRGVDGFIIATSAISNQSINETLRKKNLPFIVLDQKKADGFSDAVVTEDYQGGKTAGQHLKKLGHQKVAVLMPSQASMNIQARLAGFQSIYPEAIIIASELSKKDGQKAVKEILSRSLTGLFAMNDEIAFGLYLGLKEAGKKIPDDYSIIGYDNVEMSAFVTPALTTVAQPIFEIGQQAAELLLNRIQYPDKKWEEKVLPVELIIRSSTAPLK